jgi:hypothetical protein
VCVGKERVRIVEYSLSNMKEQEKEGRRVGAQREKLTSSGYPTLPAGMISSTPANTSLE